MEVVKTIQLTTPPLDELIAHGESIDFRLDEAQWQGLKVGDCIEFWEDFTGWQEVPAPHSRRVRVCIRHIYRAPNFRAVFDLIEADVGMCADTEALLRGLRRWWSEENEVTTGVLAFYVTLCAVVT